MEAVQSVLGEIISAIGEPHFPKLAARGLQRLTGFELAAIILHRRAGRSQIVFDDFDAVGDRRGIETYARRTHQLNPTVFALRQGAIRGRDFAQPVPAISRALRSHVAPAPEEELGYRTVGWPERQEEVGLYFEGWGGIVEFGLYRERSRKAVSSDVIGALRSIRSPLAAAFERHGRFGAAPPASWTGALSDREREVCALLLSGCTSDAIALRLRISRHTVRDHRKNIFRKLEISSLAQLFALAR